MPTSDTLAPLALKRSNDRKVTNAVHVTKSGNVTVAIANAFGLPSGKRFACTDATDYCAIICYAGKLETIRPSVRGLLMHNWELLEHASLADATSLLSEMIDAFRADCVKRGAPMAFRIHWDGDFFSGTYVAAWSRVIAANPDIQFWAYTRVASAALFLHAQRHANLALYFSADRDNRAVALTLETKGILIAYVGDTFAQGKQAFPRATRCPENNRALELITEKGSACMRCGLCVTGRKSVLFSATKR